MGVLAVQVTDDGNNGGKGGYGYGIYITGSNYNNLTNTIAIGNRGGNGGIGDT